MAKRQAKKPREIVGMYEVLDALEDALDSASPEKRKALSETLNGFARDFPEEFFWAVGPQSPALLHHLMYAIDCEPVHCPDCAGKTATVETTGRA